MNMRSLFIFAFIISNSCIVQAMQNNTVTKFKGENGYVSYTQSLLNGVTYSSTRLPNGEIDGCVCYPTGLIALSEDDEKPRQFEKLKNLYKANKAQPKQQKVDR